MAITNRTTVSEPVGVYYEKRFLMRSELNFVYMGLGQAGTVPKNQGQTVVWNRFTNPVTVTSPLTEGTDPTPAGLSATLVSATLNQYGNYERVSDMLELTAVSSVVKEAIDLLAYQAANTFDDIIKAVIVDRGQTLIASGVAARNSLASTDVFQVSEIRKALRTLHTLAAKPHTGQDYVAIAHPDVVYDLQGDTAWTNAHIYTEKGINAVYNGETGKMYGVRFVMSQNAEVMTASGSVGQSVDVYHTQIMGRGYFGVSHLQNLQTYVDSPSRNLVLRHASDIGWKASFASEVLNDSFAVRVESAATQ